MKEQIQNILNKKKEISNYKDMIFEKENDILSCIKSLDKEGVKLRQKQAALSLLELKQQKGKLQEELIDLCKSFDENSFLNKKLNSKIVAECISENIGKENLNSLKEVFKSIDSKEE